MLDGVKSIVLDNLKIKIDNNKVYIYGSWFTSKNCFIRLFKEERTKALFIKFTYTETVFYKFFIPEVVYILKLLISSKNTYGIRVNKVKELIDALDPSKDIKEVVDYSIIDSKFKFKILDHQRPIFENYKYNVNGLGYRGMLIDADTGTGKSQPLYSKILTPTGWTTMGDIQVGDEVITQDGSTTKVVSIHPQIDLQDVYEITLSDNRVCRASIDHLWDVTIKNTKAVVTTEKLIQFIYTKTPVLIKPFKDTTTFNINTDIDKYPVPPSLLGYTLLENNTFSNFLIHTLDYDSNIHYTIVLDIVTNYKLLLNNADRYKKYFMSNLWDTSLFNRYIPKEYLHAPMDIRKDIYIGILNYLRNRKLLKETATYKELTIPYAFNVTIIEDIVQLLYSLGYIVHRDVVVYKIVNNYPETKVIKATKLTVYDTNIGIHVKDIKYVGKEKTKCISIEDKSKLYITDNYIVTHNTFSSLALAESLSPELIIVVCPLNTVNKVWINSISSDNENTYNEKQEYVLASNGSYNNEKIIICHYEALDKLDKIVKFIYNKRVVIIVDEVHNFANTNSKRTELLISMVNTFITSNVLLLSGTPIKSSYKEICNILKLLSKDFDTNIERRFNMLYKNPPDALAELLINRYKRLSVKIKKDGLKLEPINTMYIKIALDKNSDKYKLSTIKKDLKEYMETRLKYITDNRERYDKEYLDLYNKVSNLPIVNRQDKVLYERNREIIRKSRDYFPLKDHMAFCNKFENTLIQLFDNTEDKAKFKELKTIYKYPILKVIGEGLGNIILKRRIDCHRDLALNLKLDNIVESTTKKTIVFSNYIEVCKAMEDTAKKFKYKTVSVYGEYTKNLTSLVSSFTSNPKLNPLIATYKSLSTGVPLIAANVVICVDMPFRMYMYEQAIGRVWRLGQDKQVNVYILQLDTGEELNINSRNIDIIKFFKEEVERITGNKHSIDLDSSVDVSLDSMDYLDVTKDEIIYLSNKDIINKPLYYNTPKNLLSSW